MSATPRRYRLLLMSVGSLVGTALLECIEALGRERFELVGMNSESGAVNNFRMDVCYLSPPARAAEAELFQVLLPPAQSVQLLKSAGKRIHLSRGYMPVTVVNFVAKRPTS